MALNFLNNALGAIRSAANFNNMKIVSEDVQKKTQGFKSTNLGTKLDEEVNGLKTLTAGLGNKTVAQITPNVPGLENELTKTVDETSKEGLDKITGGSVDNGFLDITITTPTPEGIKSSLNSIAPAAEKDFLNIFTGIVPEEFNEDIETIIEKDFTDVTSDLKTTQTKTENDFKSSTNNVTNNLLLNATLENNRKAYKDLNALNIGTVKTGEVIKLISEGKEDEAATLASELNPNITKSEAKKIIDQVDLSTSGQSEKDAISKKAKTFDTTSNNESFSEVSSLEELMIEFNRCEREVTQMVFFGYTVEEDQFLTAEDINKLEIEIGEEMTNMHYIIRKDGVIQRGRPLRKLSNFDENHNKYTICIGIVHNGDNCNVNQAKTAEYLMQSFYNTWPGGKVFNANLYDNEWEKSGLNVVNILNTLGKENFGMTSKSLSTKELIEAAKSNIKQPKIA